MIHNKYYQILKQFLGDYDKQIYGRELVGKVNISQKNIALVLNELKKEGILSSKISGNMKYFFLNKSNPLIKKYLLITEMERSVRFLEKHPKIKQISISIKADILCIFGSYAKGVQKKGSDLDLFIVGRYNKDKIKKLEDKYDVKISIKNASRSDFIKSIKESDPLIKEIISNHVLISGYEEFIEEVIKW